MGKRRATKRGKRSLAGTVVRLTALCAAALVAISVIVVLALRWIDPPVTAFMLHQTGLGGPREHLWTDWRDLGERLPLAVVAAEDQRFPMHHGFDVEAIRDALEEHARGDRLRGASTISQQVAKNVFLWPARSLLRKGAEAYLTALIELLHPKRRILELHLNVAEFGPSVYGAGAASRRYFDKAPADLDEHEAALLAAVLPSPRRLHADRPSDYVRARQRWSVEQARELRRRGWLDAL